MTDEGSLIVAKNSSLTLFQGTKSHPLTCLYNDVGLFLEDVEFDKDIEPGTARYSYRTIDMKTSRPTLVSLMLVLPQDSFKGKIRPQDITTRPLNTGLVLYTKK